MRQQANSGAMFGLLIMARRARVSAMPDPVTAKAESGSTTPKRVMMLGGTGTIGRATVRVLMERGHDVTCFLRKRDGATDAGIPPELAGAALRFGDLADPQSWQKDGFCGEAFDVLVSCLASRTGAPKDAWAIDHQAHLYALEAAQQAGVKHMVLLSAICVQKPLLAFQHAKLAFEKALMESGMTWSIVRPTAFFKSLSGQLDRVKAGKPFLLFGDGELTACKPISDNDLGNYLADCLDDPALHNRILPIGGPGPAITPLQQGEKLLALLGKEPKYSRVPPAMMSVIIGILKMLGWIIPAARDKAELARIGRYYATESMLVLNPETGEYDADATPEYGSETLFDYYQQLVRGEAEAERGDHAVF
ncbi:NAD(P)H-binding protein [Alterisphingorhabdus coralli]|uniref:Divinyl chlorophyllide a 8-vinyl-reductase, chloroplastic n=1 Tax=Alterisphingorhabdus coralli TaxID=3071408 RepID=A0AA97F578_9SPHN|nr:NAD(P)H-binding protein [Parasphingorhabdus sp. SCSIO 66989]WOE74549.1 NAD(P)H-binding protein [Parasphingorhabdus sp. SCSIO 66989]